MQTQPQPHVAPPGNSVYAYAMMRPLLLAFSLLLAACAEFPEVDAGARTNLPTPSLLPTDQLIAGTDQTNPPDPLAGPVSALQARAAALRALDSTR